MEYRKAGEQDIEKLIELRIEFLSEGEGLKKVQEEQIRKSLRNISRSTWGMTLSLT